MSGYWPGGVPRGAVCYVRVLSGICPDVVRVVRGGVRSASGTCPAPPVRWAVRVVSGDALLPPPGPSLQSRMRRHGCFSIVGVRAGVNVESSSKRQLVTAAIRTKLGALKVLFKLTHASKRWYVIMCGGALRDS